VPTKGKVLLGSLDAQKSKDLQERISDWYLLEKSTCAVIDKMYNVVLLEFCGQYISGKLL